MAMTKNVNGAHGRRRKRKRTPEFRGQWKLLRFESRQQFRDIRKAAKFVGINVERFILSASENHAVRVIRAEEKALGA